MTYTLLDVARAYWPTNTYYAPFELLFLDGANICVQSNPPFNADEPQMDTPTAPGKTLPATVIIERLAPKEPPK